MNNGLVDFNVEDLYETEESAETQIEALDVVGDEDEFDQMVMSGTRQESRSVDANLPRYGVALMSDIPLIDSNPYFYMGDFNIKNDPRDRRKGNKVNVAFFPRLKLYPFVTQEVPIPFEARAALLSEEEAEEEIAEEFNVATIESTLRSARRKHILTAERFALQIYERYKDQGFVLLDALTGIENYKEAERVFEKVLTARVVLEAIPQMPRERFGFTLQPPFLPEIVMYLESLTEGSLTAMAQTPDEAQKLLKIRAQLLTGARIARTYCDNTLSKTESLIAAKDKKHYDTPNFTHDNAKPPRDLVAMIHLNKQPRDMKALEIAQTAGAAMAAGMPHHQQQRGQIQQPVPESLIYETDIDRIVQEKLDEQKRGFDESLKRERANFEQSLTDLREEILNPPQHRSATDLPIETSPEQNASDAKTSEKKEAK